MRSKKEWGRSIRDFRRAARVNQESLAKALGTSQSKLSKAEAGKTLLTLPEHERLVAYVKDKRGAHAKNFRIG